MPKGEARDSPGKEPQCRQLELQRLVLRTKGNGFFPFQSYRPEELHYDSKLVYPTNHYYPSRVSVSTSAKWAHLTCPAHRSAVGIQGEIDGAQACRAYRLPGPIVFRSVVPDEDLTLVSTHL